MGNSRWFQEERILVFSHGLFMRAACWRLLFYPGEVTRAAMSQFRCTFFHLTIPNAALLKIRLQPEREQDAIGPLLTGHIPLEMMSYV